MIYLDTALKIVLDSAHSFGDECVDLSDSLNRILAEDVTSDIDIPPTDRSVMDGYACRREDLADELTVIETIPAGVRPKKTINPKQCAKIMTGSVMPKGADCVIMVEFTRKITDKTIRFVGDKTDDHIRRQGADIKAGQVVLNKGILIRPQHIAILASAGQVKVLVGKRPEVGVIATGDEVVEPDFKPDPWQIRNSNSPQLIAQLESIGLKGNYYRIAGDTVDQIDAVFKKASAENDVVLISGGVSMGDFDLVPGILKKNKIELLFEKVAVKPGKPTVFGKSDKVFCFGMPGNPVSGFVIFELLVKPFLYKMMEYEYQPHTIKMPLEKSIRRKDTERLEWLPVEITKSGTLKPIEYHGSAHINALRDADGLVSIDIGIAEIKGGTIVPVRLI